MCAKAHPPESPCSIRCVNCNSLSHNSDSDTCPSFLAMKAITKMSVTQNITIADARAQHSRLYSKVTQVPSRTPPSSAPQAEIPISISIQINKLHEEIEEIRSTTIAGLKSSTSSLAQDNLEECKSKIASFDKGFESLVKAHSSQSDAVLCKLAGAILGPPAAPSPIIHSDVNLQAGASNLCPPQLRSTHPLMSHLLGNANPNQDEPSYMDEY